MEEKVPNNCYLTIHGHFYQPPRENPWLEAIEEQPSAHPFHNWNERVTYECYKPNSVARIMDHNNKIIDIVNNYSLISFNFGPTLLSWLERHSPETYQRILDADKESIKLFSGHGNALAQVYNHAIMPLSTYRDKITQIYWGIKDFEYRFKRFPEGIWLSETAVDDETLSILVDFGIKFTILSPFQADKIRKDSDEPWEDVSTGSIDPAKSYRYFLKSDPDKYIDLFFYDGSISKSLAFEGTLTNGDRLVGRIKEGIQKSRDYDQLVNVATDGESYGHHTKFGDMSLAYALKIRFSNDTLALTNYGEYLEKHPSTTEVIIKDSSSWSCFHGVGRWKEDCGCSTGAAPGWNQKWRKPLRKALDWLNEEISKIYEKEARLFFKDVWMARNEYINVVLNRSKENIESFFENNSLKTLSSSQQVDALKLLEMERNSLLMFTSCGWFFADISGIETTQILKYAARSMQLAYEFGKDLENEFLQILSEAQSNIKEFGNGKDVYLRFVKPAIVSRKQVISHWAISSIFEPYPECINVYQYQIKKIDYAKHRKGPASLAVGRLELISNITTESNDMIFGLLHFGGEDFHCVIRGFGGSVEYQRIKEDLVNKFEQAPLTEVIRALDEHFGREYFTLKNLFIDKKRNIITELIKEQLEEFSTLYYKIFNDSQGSLMQLLELELDIPAEFKIAAEYSLSRNFNKIIEKIADIQDIDQFAEAIDINKESERLGIAINKLSSEERFAKILNVKMLDFAKFLDVEKCTELINIIDVAQELKLKLHFPDVQNILFEILKNDLSKLIENLSESNTYEKDKELITEILKLCEKMNFNLETYYAELSKKLLTTARISNAPGRSYLANKNPYNK